MVSKRVGYFHNKFTISVPFLQTLLFQQKLIRELRRAFWSANSKIVGGGSKSAVADSWSASRLISGSYENRLVFKNFFFFNVIRISSLKMVSAIRVAYYMTKSTVLLIIAVERHGTYIANSRVICKNCTCYIKICWLKMFPNDCFANLFFSYYVSLFCFFVNNLLIFLRIMGFFLLFYFNVKVRINKVIIYVFHL